MLVEVCEREALVADPGNNNCGNFLIHVNDLMECFVIAPSRERERSVMRLSRELLIEKPNAADAHASLNKEQDMSELPVQFHSTKRQTDIHCCLTSLTHSRQRAILHRNGRELCYQKESGN